MSKPILCVDFDGVIHSYTSGWQGALTISDPPVPGALKWLWNATEWFDVRVYSSRSKVEGATDAMWLWMVLWSGTQLGQDHPMSPKTGGVAGYPITFAHEKPAAFLTIDDRAICFEGDWSEIEPADLLSFKPWNKRPKIEPLPLYDPGSTTSGPNVAEAPIETHEELTMTEDQIKHMAERFLTWKLPSPWHPDGGITFEPIGNAGTPHEYKRDPTGTNLFDYTQALAMVRHMAKGLPPLARSGSDEDRAIVSTAQRLAARMGGEFVEHEASGVVDSGGQTESAPKELANPEPGQGHAGSLATELDRSVWDATGNCAPLVDAARIARDLFDEYAHQHLAKTPPDHNKARRNEDASAMLSAAIAREFEFAPSPSVAGLVEALRPLAEFAPHLNNEATNDTCEVASDWGDRKITMGDVRRAKTLVATYEAQRAGRGEG